MTKMHHPQLCLVATALNSRTKPQSTYRLSESTSFCTMYAKTASEARREGGERDWEGERNRETTKHI